MAMLNDNTETTGALWVKPGKFYPVPPCPHCTPCCPFCGRPYELSFAPYYPPTPYWPAQPYWINCTGVTYAS
jgi:hypothetical protein